MIERDIRLADGRTLHIYDTGDPDPDRIPIVWHHGTPNLGTPPEPLMGTSNRLGFRWISCDRPGYGPSTVNPGRSVAAVARDIEQVADHLGIDRFVVMGYSGGGAYALGCAALLGDRVLAAATLAAIAPYGAEGLDWYTGMIPSGVAALGTATAGRLERTALEASGFDYDIEFTPTDLALFDGPWGWLGTVAAPALEAGPYGQIDDDVSYTHPWGCDPATIVAPALLLHGTEDRIIPPAHARWLANHCATAELRLIPGASHFTIVTHAESALEWLHHHAFAGED